MRSIPNKVAITYSLRHNFIFNMFHWSCQNWTITLSCLTAEFLSNILSLFCPHLGTSLLRLALPRCCLLSQVFCACFVLTIKLAFYIINWASDSHLNTFQFTTLHFCIVCRKGAKSQANIASAWCHLLCHVAFTSDTNHSHNGSHRSPVADDDF